MKIRPIIVFFGTSEFAIPSLKALRNNDLTPNLIITSSDKKEPIPVKIWAEKNNIPFLQPEALKDASFLKEIKNLAPDLFIIASYGKILPKELLEIPKYKVLNIHPSLLPKHRGPSPIQATILNGDTQTGVTIMLTDEEMDHGPILANSNFKILNSRITHRGLEKILAELGSELLMETIPFWIDDQIKPKEQDHSQATFSEKITKEDGHIDWQETAGAIERKVRAYQPWPGAYSFWQKNDQKQRIIFLKVQKINDGGRRRVGEVFKANNTFAIQAKERALKIERLKPEGKLEMPGSDFLRGNSQIIGQVLS